MRLTTSTRESYENNPLIHVVAKCRNEKCTLAGRRLHPAH